MKPTIDLYLGKKIIAVVRGEQPWEWGIKLEGDIEIRNKDERETMAPIGLVGDRFAHLSMSLRDTVVHTMKGQKFSFNPTRYTIYDPRYGSEVLPQWPEELELAGNVPEGLEPSGEPTDAEAWLEVERKEETARQDRAQQGLTDFISEEENK